MESLEQRTGYKFRNSLLLAEALTHPSLAYETQRPHFDNQRLEFLGDAVLQLILTAELYRIFPKFNEGTLTKLRSRLVSRTALNLCAKSIHLGDYLLMGKGEDASGGRERASTLADALESLIGAVYLDSGLEAARDFVLRLCAEPLQEIVAEPDEINPKGHLQELLQAHSTVSPHYHIVSQQGPDHCKMFKAEVIWRGQILGIGCGKSKKLAETAAARSALHSPEIESLLDSSPLPTTVSAP
ncbi:MAG: ribonuclease III [Verrucomicrobia bacterium]|nr:ribonuclease III [Verrucomicrobiota bacterium]